MIQNLVTQEQLKQINTDLEKLRREGAMPNLDYANPIYILNSSHLTYTPTQECYIVGSMATGSGDAKITIRDIEIFTINNVVWYEFPVTKVNAGDTITITKSSVFGNIYVLTTK